MDKKKVLIASLLKPVNEPRMYKKLGLSLAEFSNAEIHIAGYKSEKPVSDRKIFFHPIFEFKRISLERFKAKQKIKQLLQEIQPHILIVNTFELLSAAVQYKKNNTCYLIYDIRENHSLNVRDLGIYPFPLNHILSSFIKIIEKRNVKSVDHFLLAEDCYKSQLHFEIKEYTILENKYQGEQISRSQGESQTITFAFTGTAHQSTGVYRALHFVKGLHELGYSVKLLLYVHAAETKTYQNLKSMSFDWLDAKISKDPLDNNTIIECYKRCDVLLAPYIISEQNKMKVPTKLYDALSNGIPIIISENQFWKDMSDPRSPVLHFNFDNQADKKLFDKIKRLFELNFKDERALWRTEKEKLKFLKHILDSP